MTKAKYRDALDELVRLRDEARLQIHLLSLESRGRLKLAEGRLLELEDRLKQAAEPLSAAVSQELERLEAQAREHLNEVAQEVRACTEGSVRKAGATRIQRPIRRRRTSP